MHVPALALLSRTLRVELRRRRTHLYRLAFVGLIFFAMVVAEATSLTLGAPGLTFFRGITYFNFACLTLAGIGYFATAITEEKDEQTIGILKMAGIGPLGLLLGKSTSRLITTLLILAVQLPFTFLAVTLGGITPEQVIATYLALAAYTVLLANLGLVCSVAFRGSAVATGAAAVLIGMLHLAGPLARDSVVAFGPGSTAAIGRIWERVIQTLLEFSVMWRMEIILSSRFSGATWSQQVTLNLFASVALFLIAWWSFEWFTREGPRRNWGWLAAVSQRTGLGSSRNSRRSWSQALLWKEFRVGLGGWPAVLFKTVAYFAALAAISAVVAEGRQINKPYWRDVTEIGMDLGLLGVIAELSIYASVLFRTEVRQRTLPLLVLLPISTGRLCRAKAAAMLLQVLPACGLILAATAVHPDGLLEVAGEVFEEPESWMVLLQFIVFVHMTVWLSLFVRWGALPLAILLVYVLTYTLGWCCVFPVAISLAGFPYSTGPRDLVAQVVPMVLLALGVVVLLQLAIAERLRTLAGR